MIDDKERTGDMLEDEIDQEFKGGIMPVYNDPVICLLESIAGVADLCMADKPVRTHFTCWVCGEYTWVDWEGGDYPFPNGWVMVRIFDWSWNGENIVLHCPDCNGRSVISLYAIHRRRSMLMQAVQYGLEAARTWKRDWKYTDEKGYGGLTCLRTKKELGY